MIVRVIETEKDIHIHEKTIHWVGLDKIIVNKNIPYK